MRRRSLPLRKLAGASLLAGLWLTGSGDVSAQQLPGPVVITQAPAPKPGAPAPQPGRVLEAVADPAPAPADGDACKPKDEKKDEPKPFWATHPVYLPYPRPGNFPMPPSGPGYYSLCDVLKGEEREKPPKIGYPPISPDFFPFYEANFGYLDDPKNTQHDYLDFTKRMHPCDNWMLSFGGEERIRYMNEVDSRLTGRNNVYELLRTRVYGDLWYLDYFRVYVEYIDARSFNEDLPPLAIDVNKSDLLNAFADVKLGEIDKHPIYGRVGRQELCYGSQRLISPLDWANTRRTFEGIKGFYRGEKLNVDAFWVKPVTISPSHFDAADANRQFAGMWATYFPKQGQAIDLYYLFLENHFQQAAKLPPDGRGGFNINTFGARYVGDYEKKLLWDFEGMWQFGEFINQSDSAGAGTAGLGYHVGQVPLEPTFWVYFDHAAGDQSGGVGGTFNQLFPFGHYYFGFIDDVGRMNINDFNLHLYLYPTNWIVFNAQGHFFYLDSGRDALYNAAGTPIRRSAKGNAGVHVGDELDLLMNFHLSQHSDILIGYSKLFAGEFIRKTGSSLSPELTYVQYSFKW